ncbi:hypothetical protein M3J09_001117 [Ascochyta lentis]
MQRHSTSSICSEPWSVVSILLQLGTPAHTNLYVHQPRIPIRFPHYSHQQPVYDRSISHTLIAERRNALHKASGITV